MIMHEITLDEYAAQCAEQPIRLGTAGSYGVETLRVMRKGEWVDYDIIIAFHPPKGDAVQMRLESDNVVSVPAEATAVAGTGELTFAGYTDGVRQISVSQIYRVAATAGAEGIAPAEPTPDVVQQILSAANDAEEIAQSVRDDADAGKFNGAQGPIGPIGPQGPTGATGPQGPKGDHGPDVALDTTLTHEGEAADAKATGDAISAVKERLDEIPKIDDTAITTTSPWSSKQIVDTLCPPIEETGNPVVCYPVAGYPLGVKAEWEPVQEGSGTPSPENIRPIKGRDIVTITRQEDNQVITLTLPETVYGGEVDAVSSEGQETWRTIIDVVDGNNLKFKAQGKYWNLPDGTAPGIGDWLRRDIISSHFFERFSGNDRSEKIWTTAKDMAGLFDTIDELNTYCSAQAAAGTPVQIAYKLAKPISFTAAGAQPIPALSGVNTVLTDSDSVTVTGRADPIKRITDLEDAVASITN